MPLKPEQKAVTDRILAERAAEHGASGLEHYRRVYALIELPCPGDEEIRRLYLVANAHAQQVIGGEVAESVNESLWIEHRRVRKNVLALVQHRHT